MTLRSGKRESILFVKGYVKAPFSTYISEKNLKNIDPKAADEKNENAHDIPEMIPRLVSYFIVILKTFTPIILIIMGMVQIIKAIANSNEDEIKKSARKSIILNEDISKGTTIERNRQIGGHKA